jgi:hypothetical protein
LTLWTEDNTEAGLLEGMLTVDLTLAMLEIELFATNEATLDATS